MKKVLMFLAAALAIAGIVTIASSTAAQRKASRANDWDQKRGTIERVEGTNVAYRYEAGGATQRGSAPARPRVTYTVGRPVLVYVNPASPAESLLELPALPPTWPLAAGSVLLLVAAVLAFFALQEGRKTPLARTPAKSPSKVSGDTTTRRQAPPMSRLKPPPSPAWKRREGQGGEEE
jgi:hypothetical protein